MRAILFITVLSFATLSSADSTSNQVVSFTVTSKETSEFPDPHQHAHLLLHSENPTPKLLAASHPNQKQEFSLTSSPDINTWNWGWLNKLLAGVVIKIPDTQFEKASFNFDLTKLECLKFHLATIELSVKEAETDKELIVDALGVTAECTGNWAYRQSVIGVPFGSGTLDAKVTQSKVVLGIELGYNQSLHLPNQASLPICQVDVTLDLSFDGGLTAKILDLFRKSISDFLTGFLQKEVKKLVKPLVATNLTKVLKQIDTIAQPLMITPTPTPIQTPPPHTINWATYPPAAMIRQFLAPYLSLNNTLNLISKITHDTGAISLPVTSNTTVNTSLANFTFVLSSLDVAGLDTLDEFELLLPDVVDRAPQVLQTRVGLGKANLTVNTLMVLVSNVNPGQVVANNISFTFCLEGLHLALDDALIVADNFMEEILSLRLPDITLGCVLRPFTSANITQAFVTYTGTPFVVLEGYDDDFDQGMEQIFGLIYELFDDALPVAVKNAASVFLPSVNSVVAKFLSQPCLVPTPYGKVIDLRQFKPIQLLNKITNSDFSAKWNINSVIDLLTKGTGSFIKSGTVFHSTVFSDQAGSLNITISDISLTNLDSFTNVTVLTPNTVDPLRLFTTIAFGDPRPVEVKVSIAVAYAPSNGNKPTVDAYAITLKMGKVNLSSRILLAINATQFWQTTLAQLVQHPTVIIPGLVNELKLESHNATLGVFNYTIEKIEGQKYDGVVSSLRQQIDEHLKHMPLRLEVDSKMIKAFANKFMSWLYRPNTPPTPETPQQQQLPTAKPTTITSTPMPSVSALPTESTLPESDKDKPNNGKRSPGPVLIGVGAVLAVVIVGLVLVIVMRRNRPASLQVVSKRKVSGKTINQSLLNSQNSQET